jgi:hypothetical protein
MLKKSRNYVAILLALVMSVSSFIPAFASDTAGSTTDNHEEPVEAAITKMLRMPEGTVTPEITFNFVATPISFEGNTAVTSSMPALNNLTVSFGTEDDNEVDNTVTNVTSITNESEDILKNVNFDALGAGIYVYEITELDSTVPPIGADESVNFSTAKYILRVYVDNHPARDGRTYAYGVIAQVVTADANGAAATTKVDVTPGEKGMIFTNDYVKTNVIENPDPLVDDTLTVSNTVIGTLANLQQHFHYTITMNSTPFHPGVEPPEYYRAYIVEGNNVLDPSGNVDIGDGDIEDFIGTPQTGPKYIKIDPNGSTSFSLKHGQRLVFVDTPVGTTYNITQAGATNYIPSHIVTSNDVPAPNVIGNVSQPMTIGPQRFGGLENSAAFTNTRDSVTPTGLSLDNLPFVLIIIFGLGCLVTYISVGARKRSLRRDK